MPWMKLCDSLHGHPKARLAGLEAMGLWVLALSHCGAYSTDGHVTQATLDGIVNGRSRAPERLVKAGLWERHPGGDGYLIHDYLEYNPSRLEVLSERENKRKAGTEGARKRWAKVPPLDGKSHGTCHAPAIGIGDAPVPIPSRPDPKREDSAPRKRSRVKPAGTEVSPEIVILREHYVETYSAAHAEVKPDFTSWARAITAFKELLALAGSVETAKTVVRNAMADAWTAKNRCQPWEIVSDYNKHRAAPVASVRNLRLAGQQPVDHDAPWMREGEAS